jgi:hypothetical protein
MTKQIVRDSMVVNPSVTQLFALNIESWDVNLTLGQPHSAMQKRHYGGPPLNPSALSNYNLSINFQSSQVLHATMTIKPFIYNVTELKHNYNTLMTYS